MPHRSHAPRMPTCPASTICCAPRGSSRNRSACCSCSRARNCPTTARPSSGALCRGRRRCAGATDVRGQGARRAGRRLRRWSRSRVQSGPSGRSSSSPAWPGEADARRRSDDAEAPLQRMVDAIKAGSHGSFIPFDRAGRARAVRVTAADRDRSAGQSGGRVRAVEPGSGRSTCSPAFSPRCRSCCGSASTRATFLPRIVRSPAWHGHEMLYGYTMAVMAGFLLDGGAQLDRHADADRPRR